MHGPVLHAVLPILLFAVVAVGMAVALLVLGNVFNPRRPGRVKRMPYESGMDPIHDARRRFNVRFHLVAIAFLVFDVELLFLYPWAVAFQPKAPGAEATQADRAAQPVQPKAAAPAATSSLASVEAAAPSASADAPESDSAQGRPPFVFVGGMIFIGLLVLGFIYDWRKGIFEWR
jgi:NADH-quinone oxidoreductase subunit A